MLQVRNPSSPRARAPNESAATSRNRESVPHCGNALATGRQDTEYREAASIHDNVAIDEDLVLAVTSMLRIDFDLQLSPKLRRHPDGVKARDSESAISNNDSGHFCLLGEDFRAPSNGSVHRREPAGDEV